MLLNPSVGLFVCDENLPKPAESCKRVLVFRCRRASTPQLRGDVCVAKSSTIAKHLICQPNQTRATCCLLLPRKVPFVAAVTCFGKLFIFPFAQACAMVSFSH